MNIISCGEYVINPPRFQLFLEKNEECWRFSLKNSHDCEIFELKVLNPNDDCPRFSTMNFSSEFEEEDFDEILFDIIFFYFSKFEIAEDHPLIDIFELPTPVNGIVCTADLEFEDKGHIRELRLNVTGLKNGLLKIEER